MNRPRPLVPVCVALPLLAALLPAVAVLDRYPQYYVDEAFYNYPAVSHLRGEGYRYPVLADCPHGDWLWAYTGPFFPRLQAVTFRLLPPTRFSFRLPSAVAGFAAVGVVAAVLAGHGYRRAAVLTAVAWAGDRAALEVLYGRPDGCCLLALAVAFGCLVRAAGTGSPWPAWGCGLAVGAACGFHVVAAPFVPAAAAGVLLLAPPGRRAGHLAAYLLGGGPPAAVILGVWAPVLLEAAEQLWWHIAGFPPGGRFADRTASLLVALRWSRFWALGVVAVWAAVAAAAARRPRPADPGGRLLVAAALFGGAGLCCVGSPRTLLPYDLVYFTAWPIAGGGVLAERLLRAGRWRAAAVALAVLVPAWLASAAWNGMRLREPAVYYAALDRGAMAGRLRAAIPPGAAVAASPELLIAALEAGLDVRPLTVFPSAVRPADGAYLLLDEGEADRPGYVHPDALRGRPLVARGGLFPAAGPLDYRYVVFGPKGG